MKDYLVELKEELIEKHKNIITMRKNRSVTKFEEEKEKFIDEISKILDIKIVNIDLRKLSTSDTNDLEINDNMIDFYPPKDGFPTRTFKFYKNKKLIIDNKKAYYQIKNLDDILLNMVAIYDKALDNRIVLSPYLFMLELTNEIKKNYNGNAKLVLKSQAIKNDMLDEDSFEEASSYFINEFIDHFIGWNFIMSVNKNTKLKQKLELLKKKAEAKGFRDAPNTDSLDDKALPTEFDDQRSKKPKTRTR